MCRSFDLYNLSSIIFVRLDNQRAKTNTTDLPGVKPHPWLFLSLCHSYFAFLHIAIFNSALSGSTLPRFTMEVTTMTTMTTTMTTMTTMPTTMSTMTTMSTPSWSSTSSTDEPSTTLDSDEAILESLVENFSHLLWIDYLGFALHFCFTLFGAFINGLLLWVFNGHTAR